MTREQVSQRCHSSGVQLTRKDLRVQQDIKLNMSQQCIFAGLKDHSKRQSITSRWREVILPLNAAMERSHVECCDQCWAPQHKRLQQRATKKTEEQENSPHEKGR